MAPPAWPLWQRVVFRYVCCHWLLYALLELLVGLHRSIGRVWLELAEEGTKLPGWFATIGDVLGKPDAWMCELTFWLGQQSWAPIGVVRQAATSTSDTSHVWMRLACIVVLAALATVVWCVLDRRPSGHPVLGRWLHVGARWWVGLVLFGAGAAKLYGAHPGEPTLAQLTTEAGDSSLAGLFSTFLAANRPYQLLAGVLEVLGGVLLLHHRSALLGALVAAVTLTHIVALNLFCDLPVKVFSAHLLVTVILLMAPWRQRLWELFVSNRFSESIDMKTSRQAWLAWLLIVFGWLWFGVAAYDAHIQYRGAGAAATERSVLYGVWDVTRVEVEEPLVADLATGPAPTVGSWQRLALDKACTVFVAGGQRLAYALEADMAASTLTLRPPTGEGEAMTFAVTYSAPLADDDHAVVDPEKPAGQPAHATLVLRGTVAGRTCTLHASRHVFDLGFRIDWVQDK